jgi:hypothetical protein
MALELTALARLQNRHEINRGFLMKMLARYLHGG